MSFDPSLAFVGCINCDTATLPTAMGRGWYHCDVCSKSFDSGIRPSATAGTSAYNSRRGRVATPSSAGSPLLQR